MAEHTPGRLAHQVQRITQSQAGATGLPFAEVLDPAQVRQALQEHQVKTRACVLSPRTTLYAFLGQVLHPDHSCRRAVAELLAARLAQGQRPCAPHTGPYCKARRRLPEGVPAQLARQVGQRLHAQTPPDRPPDRLLQGRPVKIVDGRTVSMPDSKANQAAYPQPSSQAAGLGFPIARMVALISLACGAILDLAVGPYSGKQTGEAALFRRLWDGLAPGDVVLGDRGFCSYWNLALLGGRGVDCLFRLHQCRKADFRRGRRLGKHDHLVTWCKPKQRPDWMDQATYEQVPATLSVRQVRVSVGAPGFRVRSLLLATTLLDAALYPKEELAQAFRARWHAELDLRSIKVAMRMDVLRCKSPALVRKELWVHLLAYNLARTVMAQAAQACGLRPRELSLSGAVQTLGAFAPRLGLVRPDRLGVMDAAMLDAIGAHRVGDRPDRVEPRAVKRRPKKQRLLTVPREQARRKLLRAA